jgi:predicted peroxiredoxin
MPKVLVTTLVGPSDPTRASIPFHVVANGVAPSKTDCGVVLVGDATDLLKRDVASGVRGVGVPPLTELLAKCDAAGIQFYV